MKEVHPLRKWVATVLAAVLLPLSVMAESFTLLGYDSDRSGIDWNTNLFFERMTERTGIQTELTQVKDAAEWIQRKAALTAENAPDGLFKADLTEQDTLRLYQQGVLLDLKPLLDSCAPNLSALLRAHPEWERAISLDNGAIVALPTLNELPNNNALWINQSWLNTLGLSMPTTAEELQTVLTAFRDGDPNGNGTKDEIPLTYTGLWDLKYLSHAFGFVMDDYGLMLDGNTVRFMPTDPANRALVEWLHGLWQEKLLDRSGLTMTDTARAISDPKAAITYGVIIAPTPLTLVPAEALDQYTLLMPLVSGGKQIFRAFPGQVTRGTFAITTACKAPDKLLAWVDTLYGEAGAKLAQNGLDGVEYERHADGSWSWIGAPEEVSRSVLPNATIVNGTAAPTWLSADNQLRFADERTHRLVTELTELHRLTVQPMPPLTLNADDRAAVTALQNRIAPLVDLSMIHWITGEAECNDDAWQQFAAELENEQLDAFLSLWQKQLPNN